MQKRLLLSAAAMVLAASGLSSRSYAATDWLLNDFETASQFGDPVAEAPNAYAWHGNGGMAVTQSTVGAVGSAHSMNIAANGQTGFQWGAKVEYNAANVADPIQMNAVNAFNFAGSGHESGSWFEFDVTWLASENPGMTWEGVQMSINSVNGWTQSPDNLGQRSWGTAGFDIPVETQHIVTPAIGTWSGFGTNKLPDGDGQWFQVNIAYNPNGDAAGNVHIDNLHLFTPDVPEPASLGLLAGGIAGLMLRRRSATR